jgi:hypothetical protein
MSVTYICCGRGPPSLRVLQQTVHFCRRERDTAPRRGRIPGAGRHEPLDRAPGDVDAPDLLITNDLAATAGKDLFARYAERMITENELDAEISGFHLNALSSGLPLNVDLDTTLTVAAGNCYRLLARTLPRYEQGTPTGFGGASSTTQEPSPCRRPRPGVDLAPGPKHPSSSTPASPNSTSPSLVARTHTPEDRGQ